MKERESERERGSEKRGEGQTIKRERERGLLLSHVAT